MPVLQKNKKQKTVGKDRPPRLGMQALIALLIFLAFSGVYSFVSDKSSATKEIPISELAKSVVAGDIKTITVEGEKLTATYADQSVKISKKETEDSLSATLARYGVTPEKLQAIEINVKNDEPSGNRTHDTFLKREVLYQRSYRL